MAPGPGRLVCFAPLPAPPLQELRVRAARGLPRAPSWRSSHWPPVSLCAQASAWRILSEGGRTGPSVPRGSSARRLRRPLSLLIRVVCEASGVCSASLSSVSSARFEPVLNFATAARDETRLRTGGGDRDWGRGGAGSRFLSAPLVMRVSWRRILSFVYTSVYVF